MLGYESDVFEAYVTELTEPTPPPQRVMAVEHASAITALALLSIPMRTVS